MKKLLEAMDQFAGGKDQKVGLAGQSRGEGTPKKFVGGVHRQHPDHHKLVGGESTESEEEVLTDAEDIEVDEYADTFTPEKDADSGTHVRMNKQVAPKQQAAIKPKADQRDLDFTSRQFKDIPSLVEELTNAYEDYVKNKSVPDAQKSFKLHKMAGVSGARCYTVKNEKGEDVMRGNRTDCQAYIDKKHRALEDDKLEEGLPGSLSKSDYTPGETKKHESSNCKTCCGRKVMYKLDGKLFADNKKGATKVKCSACNGTGDKSVKESRGHKVVASKLKDIESRKARDKQNAPKRSKAELEKFIKDHEGGGVPTFGKGAEVKRARAELKGMTETKADPLGAWIAHKNGKQPKKFKTREGAKKFVASHEGYTINSSEGFQNLHGKNKKVGEGADDVFRPDSKVQFNSKDAWKDAIEKMWPNAKPNGPSESYFYNNGEQIAKWRSNTPNFDDEPGKGWVKKVEAMGEAKDPFAGTPFNKKAAEKKLHGDMKKRTGLDKDAAKDPKTVKKDGKEMYEAGGKSENRELWDRIKSRGTTSSIDREKYTDRPGLEGPFKMKSGKVVYYDPKEGQYYDPGSDVYIYDTEQFEGETNEAFGQPEPVQMNKRDEKKYVGKIKSRNMGSAKTPGVALSKAFKNDFDGKQPQRQTTPHEPIALTGQYSKTGKPGGPLVNREKIQRLAAKLDQVRAMLKQVKDQSGTQEVDEAFPNDLMPAAQPGQQQVQQGAMPVAGQQAPTAPAVAGQQPAAPIQGQAQQPVPNAPAPAVGTPMAAQAAVPDMVAGIKKSMQPAAFNTFKQTIAKV